MRQPSLWYKIINISEKVPWVLCRSGIFSVLLWLFWSLLGSSQAVAKAKEVCPPSPYIWWL